MEVLLDAAQAKELDRYTTETFGLSSLVLMERAAYETAACIRRLPEGRRRVFCLAGTGNNGADGLAVLRILTQWGYEAAALVVGDRRKATKEWLVQYDLLKKLGVEPVFAKENADVLPGFDFYVDALFGIGLKREIGGIFRQAIEAFMEAAGKEKSTVVAVDICSGIDAASGKVLGAAVRADITVTFGFRRLGQYLYPGAAYSGQICAADIGLAPLAMALEGPFVRLTDKKTAVSQLAVRDPSGNKGTFGRVFVLAGSKEMTGAACFCAEAAYRSGAGLVTAAVPEESRVILQERLPEAVLYIRKKEQSRENLKKALARARAIVAGPGLGQGEEARESFECILSEHKEIPLVIDADGLNLLAQMEPYPLSEQVILTPHPGELARLLGMSMEELAEMGQIKAARLLGQRWGCTVVCKDARTLVCTLNQELYYNASGNDGMATGGSGDILAGVIGGLLAQGYRAKEAAVLGVYLHGLAGDRAASRKGRHGMLAGDILAALPEAFREIEELQKDRAAGPVNEVCDERI